MYPPRCELPSQRVAEGFKRKLRSGVGAEPTWRNHPGDTGSHQDDTAGGFSNQWQKSLDDCHRTDHVDVELTPQFLHRQKLERPADGDPGIVDKTVEPSPPSRLLHPVKGSCNIVLDGYIQMYRDDVFGSLFA